MRFSILISLSVLVTLTGCNSNERVRSMNDPEPSTDARTDPAKTAPEAKHRLRVATFNTSLHRRQPGELTEDLRNGDANAKRIATILRTVRPDILLLNEFDYDESGNSIRLFRDQYLNKQTADDQTKPIAYPHFYSAAVNTGVPSGRDLDHDGSTDGPADSYGFGQFPGQYGMVILSRFPIDFSAVRTFQNLLWKDMPDHLEPVDPDSGEPWYSTEDWNILRLSSKSHWDVPVKVNSATIHILAAHPTPPAFDGPEDRNGKRNADEIRFWIHYISPDQGSWIRDDSGTVGGLNPGEHFFVLGDLNADPRDGSSLAGAISRLLDHPRVNNNCVPASEGARLAAQLQGKKNKSHTSPPAHDTSDFNDFAVGNLRVDYVLPSRTMTILDSGVYWPTANAGGEDLISASDHRLVWVDVEVAN